MGEQIGTNLISVTSPDHHRALITGLWNFFALKRGTDLTIMGLSHSIEAHQLVLEVFLSVEDLVTVSDLQASTLDPLLEFVYNGRVDVRPAQLDDLLALATRLNFRLLMEAVERARNKGSQTFGFRIENARSCVERMDSRIVDWEIKKKTDDVEVVEATTTECVERSVSLEMAPINSAPPQKEIQPETPEANIEHPGLSNPDDDASDVSDDDNDLPENDESVNRKSVGVGGASPTCAPRDHVCIPCGRRCITRAGLRRHQDRCGQSKFRPTCPICNKQFSSNSSLFRHRLIHTGQKFKCGHCDVVFSRADRLKKHVRVRHPLTRFQVAEVDCDQVEVEMLVQITASTPTENIDTTSMKPPETNVATSHQSTIIIGGMKFPDVPAELPQQDTESAPSGLDQNVTGDDVIGEVGVEVFSQEEYNYKIIRDLIGAEDSTSLPDPRSDLVSDLMECVEESSPDALTKHAVTHRDKKKQLGKSQHKSWSVIARELKDHARLRVEARVSPANASS